MTSVGRMAHVGVGLVAVVVGTMTFVTNRLELGSKGKNFSVMLRVEKSLGQVTGSFDPTQETQGKSFGLWAGV